MKDVYGTVTVRASKNQSSTYHLPKDDNVSQSYLQLHEMSSSE
jgi:hypothetical protein